MPHRVVSCFLGVVGGVIGGVVGYFVFFWISRQGYYGLMIPGAFLGLGSGLLARHRSIGRGVICGIAGLILGLYTEWRYAPMVADDSFGYMVTHFHEKLAVKQIMLVAGSVLAFWLARDATMRGPGDGPNTPPAPPLPQERD